MSEGPRGPQGPQGNQGGTGPTGFQGIQGPQGPPYGPPGPNFYSTTTRLIVSTYTSGGTLSFASSNSSTYFNITTTAPSALSNDTSAGSPTSGMFWVFRNNTSGLLSLTLSNATAQYAGNPTAGSVYIGSGNSLTLVSTGGTSFIAF